MKISLTFQVTDGPSFRLPLNINWMSLYRTLTLALVLGLAIAEIPIAAVSGREDYHMHGGWGRGSRGARGRSRYVLGIAIPSTVVFAIG
jgi:hypothetical protein